MSEQAYKPKFQIDISEEQYQRTLRCFPDYGLRKAVMGRVLDEVMDLIERKGMVVIGIILDQDTPVKSIIPSLAKASMLEDK